MKAALLPCLLLAGCLAQPTGDLNKRTMPFNAPRDDVYEATIRGLERRGYEIDSQDKDSFSIDAVGGSRYCTIEAEEKKNDEIHLHVYLSGAVGQKEFRELRSAIRKALGRILDAKKK
ncbi:MAG: hypothetical protein ACYTGN_00670 [Planctomycetota bacterium]|jgi:hypothetical protein